MNPLQQREVDESGCGFAPRRNPATGLPVLNENSDSFEVQLLEDLLAKHDKVKLEQNCNEPKSSKSSRNAKNNEDSVPNKPVKELPAPKTEHESAPKIIPAPPQIKLPPNDAEDFKYIAKLENDVPSDVKPLNLNNIQLTLSAKTQEAVSLSTEKILNMIAMNCEENNLNDQLINNNCIGLLQNMCMTHHLPPPMYETISETGMPHERVFTMCCKIVHLEEIGIGKTKKIARHIAAHKMLQRLREIPMDTLDIKQTLCLNQPSISPRAAKLKEELRAYDFVALLEEISLKNHFTIGYVHIEREDAGMEGAIDLNVISCMVQISTMPVGVCVGNGATAEEAKQTAARNALEWIKLLVKRRTL